jgi:riboflavin synthase
MFTGIIETTGEVKEIMQHGTNTSFWIESSLAENLQIDQSVSHNGVCLTVESIKNSWHKVTAIEETLLKTNLGQFQTGDIINLERCMQLNGRLDGHIVQGHVDSTAICTGISEKKGSWEYQFEIDRKFSSLIIEKGSITLNGISLTIFNITDVNFTVAIIPYTYEHSNIGNIKKGNKANVEFDIIGKYISRLEALKNKPYL